MGLFVWFSFFTVYMLRAFGYWPLILLRRLFLLTTCVSSSLRAKIKVNFASTLASFVGSHLSNSSKLDCSRFGVGWLLVVGSQPIASGWLTFNFQFSIFNLLRPAGWLAFKLSSFTIQLIVSLAKVFPSLQHVRG